MRSKRTGLASWDDVSQSFAGFGTPTACGARGKRLTTGGRTGSESCWSCTWTAASWDRLETKKTKVIRVDSKAVLASIVPTKSQAHLCILAGALSGPCRSHLDG